MAYRAECFLLPGAFDLQFPVEIVLAGDVIAGEIRTQGCLQLGPQLGVADAKVEESADVDGRSFFGECQSMNEGVVRKDGDFVGIGVGEVVGTAPDLGSKLDFYGAEDDFGEGCFDCRVPG